MARNQQMRIAFVVHERIWLGGLNYLRNVMTAARLLPGSPIVPIIVTGIKATITQEQFPNIEMIRTPLLDRKSPAWILRKAIATAFGQDLLFKSFLLRHGISVLSHSSDLGKQRSIATVGWIPDFQHIHLPQGFTKEQFDNQSKSSENLCAKCTKVIVSSESAFGDLKNLYPAYADKAEVLQFVATPPPLETAATLDQLSQKYEFSGPYFHLPNQFWSHKNHRIVIGALKELKQRGSKILVLATGPTKDDRNPSYFPSLMQYAEECGVTEMFRVLGPVPFPHLVGLMLHSVALINPSKFEGWSTTVEEAKSLGKVMILSDIPVHREQAPTLGMYFDPDDAHALADLLDAASSTYDPELDARMQKDALSLFSERQQAFGRAYERIVLRALEAIGR